MVAHAACKYRHEQPSKILIADAITLAKVRAKAKEKEADRGQKEKEKASKDLNP